VEQCKQDCQQLAHPCSGQPECGHTDEQQPPHSQRPLTPQGQPAKPLLNMVAVGDRGQVLPAHAFYGSALGCMAAFALALNKLLY
jgi:hypothetical protein